MSGSSIALKHMVELPGGAFRMGCDDFYPEERPVRRVEVDAFWIDRHPVTVAEFRRFVKETGHVTWAEQVPDPADYPDADPSYSFRGRFHLPPLAKAQSTCGTTRTGGHWVLLPGADWRHPDGPGSNVGGRELHPGHRTSPVKDAAA